MMWLFFRFSTTFRVVTLVQKLYSASLKIKNTLYGCYFKSYFWLFFFFEFGENFPFRYIIGTYYHKSRTLLYYVIKFRICFQNVWIHYKTHRRKQCVKTLDLERLFLWHAFSHIRRVTIRKNNIRYRFGFVYVCTLYIYSYVIPSSLSFCIDLHSPVVVIDWIELIL